MFLFEVSAEDVYQQIFQGSYIEILLLQTQYTFDEMYIEIILRVMIS